MIRKSLTVALALGLMLALSACGEKVTVPPSYAGKILTSNGFEPEAIPPSKFRLDKCWFYCDELVLVQVADIPAVEQFQLFMPKDQLNMSFDIRFTYSVKSSDDWIDQIVSSMPAQTSEAGNKIITAERVYETYGQPQVRTLIRETMAGYSINEVASSREAVSNQIRDAVKAIEKTTPISFKAIAIADVQFPAVIVNRQELLAQRKIEIEQAEASKQVTLVEKQAELEAARADRAIRRERAEAAREENKIFAESVSKEYLAYKELEVLQDLARNPNTVFMPFGAIDTVGAGVRMFNPEQSNSDIPAAKDTKPIEQNVKTPEEILKESQN